MGVINYIEKQALPQMARVWMKQYKSYEIVKPKEGPSIVCLNDNPSFGEVHFTTNDLMIDALKYGEQLCNISYQMNSIQENLYKIDERYWEAYALHPYYHEEQLPVLREWIAKYNFIPLGEMEPINEAYISDLSRTLIYFYEHFCEYIKAKYGLNECEYISIARLSQDDCRRRFVGEAHKKLLFQFNKENVEITYIPFTLLDLLNGMLYDYITTSDDLKPFVCELCGKSGLKRNPKQCYCAECSPRRYQISRNRKKQGGKPHGKA